MSKLTKRANRYRRSDRFTYAFADPNYRKALLLTMMTTSISSKALEGKTNMNA